MDVNKDQVGFWVGWVALWQLLFVAACIIGVTIIISYIARKVIQKRNRAMQERVENRERIRLALVNAFPGPELDRRPSVNFGIKALERNETPASANIVDSQSLRDRSPPRCSNANTPVGSSGVGARIGPPRRGRPRQCQSSGGSASATTTEGTDTDKLQPPMPRFARREPRVLYPQLQKTSRQFPRMSWDEVFQRDGTDRNYKVLQSMLNQKDSEEDIQNSGSGSKTHFLQVPTESASRPVSTGSIDFFTPGQTKPIKSILKNRDQGQTPPLNLTTTSTPPGPTNPHENPFTNPAAPRTLSIPQQTSVDGHSPTPSTPTAGASTKTSEPTKSSDDTQNRPEQLLAIPQPTRAAPKVPLIRDSSASQEWVRRELEIAEGRVNNQTRVANKPPTTSDTNRDTSN